MNPPLVSAIVPNYNHGRYLRQCLAGLTRQTLTDVEVLVTDDGSTDDSREILEAHAAKDPRIKPSYFPRNRGVIEACKDLFGRATGKYLYCGAADDFVVNKDFFKNAVAALEGDPRPAGFYGLTGIYHAENEKLVSSCGTAEVVGYNTPLQCCQGFVQCRSVITTPSAVWRRDLYMQHGGGVIDRHLQTMGPQADFYISHALAFMFGMTYEKTPFACQRIFEARTNYSANLQLWETAARYAELERGLRAVGPAYPGIEADWQRWRAYWMVDVIRKSGVQL